MYGYGYRYNSGLVLGAGGGGGGFTNTYSTSFDGVDDYVSAGDILNNNSVGSEAFSMSCWFKTSASGGSYYLIGKAKNSSQVDGYHFFINSSGQIRFFLGRYTGTASTSPWIYVRTTTTWNDGNWHNVVLTYNGNQNTSGLSIYVDGNSQSLTSIYNNTPYINSTDCEFIIGARGKSGDIGGLFSGEIDEASYFNSELTSEDVTAIYNSGLPTDLSLLATPPLAWWRMGDGVTAFPTIPDVGSLASNDGTAYNENEATMIVPDVP